MNNKIPNRQAICNVLIEKADADKDIVVLCSDSRGSASLTEFAKAHKEQFIEVGIAEQNLVSISAGLARTGKKVFAASPACFLSTRSMEQAKVDVAYSNTNVKLIGISGGISYGSLGMTHHSNQDIATMASIPNMRVYLPSDRHQTKCLIEALLEDQKPAYIRVGRNPVEDIYPLLSLDTPGQLPFTLDQATVLREGDDLAIIACGEMVRPALLAAQELEKKGIHASVLDMYCVKPMDKAAVLKAAGRAKAVITVEEHSVIGGMGAMVCQIIAANCPKPVRNLALPDTPAVAGKSQEVFDYYGLSAEGIAATAWEMLSDGE
ncbi:transketolase [Anaerotaenia torta]|uniref:transketolase family protein n=1 Tax=Anaerotaenia torta TaxID=433293 RepID=UPI003D224FB8